MSRKWSRNRSLLMNRGRKWRAPSGTRHPRSESLFHHLAKVRRSGFSPDGSPAGLPTALKTICRALFLLTVVLIQIQNLHGSFHADSDVVPQHEVEQIIPIDEHDLGLRTALHEFTGGFRKGTGCDENTFGDTLTRQGPDEGLNRLTVDGLFSLNKGTRSDSRSASYAVLWL